MKTYIVILLVVLLLSLVSCSKTYNKTEKFIDKEREEILIKYIFLDENGDEPVF